MNILKQFVILCVCLFIGAMLKTLIPLPIPETIYGMAILFILFATKRLKTDDVKAVSNGILDYFALLFVPTGVGIINNFDIFKENFIPMMLVTVISAAISLLITMLVVQKLQERRGDV